MENFPLYGNQEKQWQDELIQLELLKEDVLLYRKMVGAYPFRLENEPISYDEIRGK